MHIHYDKNIVRRLRHVRKTGISLGETLLKRNEDEHIRASQKERKRTAAISFSFMLYRSTVLSTHAYLRVSVQLHTERERSPRAHLCAGLPVTDTYEGVVRNGEDAGGVSVEVQQRERAVVRSSHHIVGVLRGRGRQDRTSHTRNFRGFVLQHCGQTRQRKEIRRRKEEKKTTEYPQTAPRRALAELQRVAGTKPPARTHVHTYGHRSTACP